MHADASFRIGKTHAVCQDYAVAFCRDGLAAAIVSDGCSSSPMTDFGSRLITRAFARSALAIGFGDLLAETRLGQSMVSMAAEWASATGLPAQCLDATCLAVVSDGEQAKALVFGDGVLFAERRAGGLDIWQFNYPAGRPAYPSYSMAEEATFQEFFKQTESKRWVKTLYHSHLSAEGSWIDFGEVNLRVEDFLLPTSFTYSASAYRLVGVLTDGASSFGKIDATSSSKAVTPVQFSEIAAGLLRFPDTTGQFALARLRRFEKDCLKRGLFHSDDLSMAVISF